MISPVGFGNFGGNAGVGHIASLANDPLNFPIINSKKHIAAHVSFETMLQLLNARLVLVGQTGSIEGKHINIYV